MLCGNLEYMKFYRFCIEMDLNIFKLGLCLLVIYFAVNFCKSLPIPGDVSTRQGQWDYLKKYQHVPSYISSRARSASDPDEASFSAAVSAFQRFAQLPITGQVDVATLSLMQESRCSVGDDNENDKEGRFSIQGSKWGHNPLTYKLELPPSGNAPNRCAARARLINAFEVWQYAIQKDFQEVVSNANMETSFVRGSHGDSSPFDGPGKTLAHAFFPFFGGNIHVDEDDQFSDNAITPQGTHSLLLLYIHEIGHSLGLGHSNQQDAIMWPYMYRGKTFLGLGSDDLDAIRYLYGEKQRPTTANTQSCVEYTSGGTAGDSKCVFPFTYKGFTFNECTSIDHTKKWCSTTSLFIGLWGNCIGCQSVSDSTSCRPNEKDGTFLGTALGAPCVFPFSYKGVTYNKCTSVDHFRPWCSTTSTFEGCWGNCAGCEEPPRLATCNEQTKDGKGCQFPFFYKEKIYYSCTLADHHELWCSHQAIYVGNWSPCHACP